MVVVIVGQAYARQRLWIVPDLAEIGWERVDTRAPDSTIHYPVAPAARAYGASVEVATDSPREAYAGRQPIEPARSPWPLA